MSEVTKIEWTDSTWNPWIGCTKISPACDNCYAEVSTPSRTLSVNWGPGQPRRRTSVQNWNLPLRWNVKHDSFFAEHGRRQRVFCASLADVFDGEVPVEWLVDLLSVVARTPNLDWQLLTKRIGIVKARLKAAAECSVDNAEANLGKSLAKAWLLGNPPGNVWLGATICNQAEADRDIPKLLKVPAKIRFLSMEPLLGPVNLIRWIGWMPCIGASTYEDVTDGFIRCDISHAVLDGIDWVIVGESGANTRPMHPDWALSLRDQCAEAGVPFLFKQWGEWVPMIGHTQDIAVTGAKFLHPDGTIMGRVGAKAAGRVLMGLTHHEFPLA